MAPNTRRVRFEGLPPSRLDAGPPPPGSASTPSSGPATSLELTYFKKAATDRFSEWRRGNYNWTQTARRKEIRAVVHPKPGGWDPWDLIDPADDGTLDRIRDNRRRFRNIGAGQAGLDGERGQESWAKELEQTQFRPVGFRQVRRLGTGGKGLVWLFRMGDTRGRAHNVVVKVGGARVREVTKREIHAMKRLSGSRHTTQRLLLRAMPDPAFDMDAPSLPRDIARAAVDLVRSVASLSLETRTGLDAIRRRIRRIRRLSDGAATNPKSGRIRRARGRVDDAEDVLVMEYMPNGTLGSWLERLMTRGTENGGPDDRVRVRIPEKILWSILNCLWRGCVAMAYPGRQQEEGQDPRRTQIPVATEILPPLVPGQRARNRGPRDPMVHFDLDPSGVFIGEFDDSDHQTFPLLKISNFGLSEFARSSASRMTEDEQEQYFWTLRSKGNPACFLPEQTTDAWDYVPNARSLIQSAVAGNYGPRSNMFHIGLIMWQLITGMAPEVPFVPRPYAVEILDYSMSGWTYGHALLDRYEDWTQSDGVVWPSRELRDVIANCMDYLPRRRPGLTRLLNVIERHFRERQWDETDEEMRVWSQQWFGDAPPRSTSGK